jgi:DNA topoisomerase IA
MLLKENPILKSVIEQKKVSFKGLIIYPLKNATEIDLEPEILSVYELIVRHFAACNSQDAIITKTLTVIKVGEEFFTHSAT